MPKQGKNNVVRPDFTYYEKRMMTHYGTQTQRLGINSQIKIGMCQIYLHQFSQPVCCDKGHVYCKQCVIENLVEQKKKNEFLMEQYELKQASNQIKQQKDQISDLEKQAQKIKEFEKLEANFDPQQRKQMYENSTFANQKEKVLTKKELYEEHVRKNKNLSKQEQAQNSFWLSLDKKQYDEQVQKPDMKLKCPATLDHSIKLKKLNKLVLQQTNEGAKEDAEFACFVCKKQLNFQKIGASKNCGHVQCLQCLQISVKETKKCGFCLKQCEKNEIIEIQNSQSSFSHHNQVEATKYEHTCIV